MHCGSAPRSVSVIVPLNSIQLLQPIHFVTSALCPPQRHTFPYLPLLALTCPYLPSALCPPDRSVPTLRRHAAQAKEAAAKEAGYSSVEEHEAAKKKAAAAAEKVAAAAAAYYPWNVKSLPPAFPPPLPPPLPPFPLSPLPSPLLPVPSAHFPPCWTTPTYS